MVHHGVTGAVVGPVHQPIDALGRSLEDRFDRLVDWAHHGPRYAVVDQVAIQAEPPEGLDTFRIT